MSVGGALISGLVALYVVLSYILHFISLGDHIISQNLILLIYYELECNYRMTELQFLYRYKLKCNWLCKLISFMNSNSIMNDSSTCSNRQLHYDHSVG